MSYKPDYGLKLLNDGCSKDVDHIFYDFRLYNLSILGQKQYSTMVDMPYDGEVYALSLDFNERQLFQILTKAAPMLQAYIKAELAREHESPRFIRLDGIDVHVSFGVRARLGQLQKVEKESFVPLVAVEIM